MEDPYDISWLDEMGLDSSIFMDQQCDFMDTLGDEFNVMLGQDYYEGSLSTGTDSSPRPSSTLVNIPSTNSITSLCQQQEASTIFVHEPPAKLQKPNNFSKFSTNTDRASASSSAPMILNFGKAAETSSQHGGTTNQRLNAEEEAAVSEVLRSQGSVAEAEEQPKKAQTGKKTGGRIRPPSQTYDHIIAERKRREQLSQRFVALSTIVPGLKKMDKTSVLGDAIKYLKHLQERVKILEEQATKQTMESVVLVKKSQIMAEDEGSSDEKSGSSDEQPLPEIEARVCNNNILLRVHCEKQKGILVNLLSKIEKLNLSVVNTNVTPFGSLALDITIVAEMEKEFSLTVKEVLKKLRAAI